MNQKRDYISLRSKGKFATFGIGLLSMMICLGAQLAQANLETNLLNVDLEAVVQATVTGTVTDSNGTPPAGHQRVGQRHNQWYPDRF